MKTKTLTAWPSIVPESTDRSRMTAYPNTRQSKNGVVKLLPTPVPPDDATIDKLNALATQAPFCRLHKVKKHELL